MTVKPNDLRPPDLVAEVRLYSVDEGGKAVAIRPGYSCPCFGSADAKGSGWDARLLIEEPFAPGTERRVSFVFLSVDGADAIRRAKYFYLWDGRFVGEALVVQSYPT